MEQDSASRAKKEKALKDLAEFASQDTTKFVHVRNSKLEQCEDDQKWDTILSVVQEFQQELGQVGCILVVMNTS